MKNSPRIILSLTLVVACYADPAYAFFQSTGQTRGGRSPASTTPRTGTSKSISPRPRATVTLKDQSQVTGDLIKSDTDAVQIMVAGNQLTIKMSEVSNISILPPAGTVGEPPAESPRAGGTPLAGSPSAAEDRRFTGTYKLDAASVPDVSAIISQAGPRLSATEVQQNVNVVNTLLKAEYLVLSRQGDLMTFVASGHNPDRFKADGSERTFNNAGSPYKGRAFFDGNSYSILTEFDNGIKAARVLEVDADKKVLYSKLTLDVTGMNGSIVRQPFVFHSRYDRVSQVAEWSYANTAAASAAAPSSGAASNSVLSIQAGIIYKMGGPQPVARVTFYLLDEDLSRILQGAGLQPRSGFNLVETMAAAKAYPLVLGKFYNDAMTAVRPHIIAQVTTGFDGRAQFTPLPAGTYYVMGIAPTRKSSAIWNLRVDLKPGIWSVILDQNNAAMAL